jgi:signal transduction histidine kinase
MKENLTALLREPRAPDPPPRFWFDWLLVLGTAALAVLELALRSNLTLPLLSLLWVWLAAVGLHIRRWHPLTAVLLVFGAGMPLNLLVWWLAVPWEGLYSMVIALIIPYALCRWGSGREILVGVAVMLSTWAVDVATDFESVAEGLSGVVMLMLPVTIGTTVRLQDRARRRSLEEARLRERERLARELHDSVAHHVSAIAIQAQAGRVLAGSRPEALPDTLAAIEEAASRTLEDMRSILSALRSGDDAALEPLAGVQDVARLAAGTRSGPAVSVELDGDLAGLRPQVGSGLYRLAQESVTNARRHARNARSIAVRVQGLEDRVRLRVHDDGEAPSGARGSGFGLVGMAERVKLLGGSFHAGPSEEGGWTVSAEIPKTGQRLEQP